MHNDKPNEITLNLFKILSLKKENKSDEENFLNVIADVLKTSRDLKKISYLESMALQFEIRANHIDEEYRLNIIEAAVVIGGLDLIKLIFEEIKEQVSYGIRDDLLWHASRLDKVDIVEYLLGLGANLNSITSIKGINEPDLISEVDDSNSVPSSLKFPLAITVKMNAFDAGKMLLLHGAEVTPTPGSDMKDLFEDLNKTNRWYPILKVASYLQDALEEFASEKSNALIEMQIHIRKALKYDSQFTIQYLTKIIEAINNEMKRNWYYPEIKINQKFLREVLLQFKEISQSYQRNGNDVKFLNDNVEDLQKFITALNAYNINSKIAEHEKLFKSEEDRSEILKYFPVTANNDNNAKNSTSSQTELTKAAKSPVMNGQTKDKIEPGADQTSQSRPSF